MYILFLVFASPSNLNILLGRMQLEMAGCRWSPGEWEKTVKNVQILNKTKLLLVGGLLFLSFKLLGQRCCKKVPNRIQYDQISLALKQKKPTTIPNKNLEGKVLQPMF